VRAIECLFGSVFFLPLHHSVTPGNLVDHHVSDVVASGRVLCSGISQPDDEPSSFAAQDFTE
jgi:hypothetical protein